jgi:hypothetical protein
LWPLSRNLFWCMNGFALIVKQNALCCFITEVGGHITNPAFSLITLFFHQNLQPIIHMFTNLHDKWRHTDHVFARHQPCPSLAEPHSVECLQYVWSQNLWCRGRWQLLSLCALCQGCSAPHRDHHAYRAGPPARMQLLSSHHLERPVWASSHTTGASPHATNSSPSSETGNRLELHAKLNNWRNNGSNRKHCPINGNQIVASVMYRKKGRMWLAKITN